MLGADDAAAANGANERAGSAAGGAELRSEGFSDGFETDSKGFVCAENIEDEDLSLFNPANPTATSFLRDPRINWVDTSKSTRLLPSDRRGNAGYDFVQCPFAQRATSTPRTIQLSFSQSFFPSTDRRVRPFSLFRAKIPNDGIKVLLR